MKAALTTRTTAERELLERYRRVNSVSPNCGKSIRQWAHAVEALVGNRLHHGSSGKEASDEGLRHDGR
jgi:hypothetical protein